MVWSSRVQLSIHWPVKELKNRFCVSLERQPLPWVERTSAMAGPSRDCSVAAPIHSRCHTSVCAGLRSLWPIEALEEAHSQFISSFLSQHKFSSPVTSGHVVIYKQAAAQAETKLLSFLFNKSSCVAENTLSLFASLHFNHSHHSLFNSETQRCALLLGDTHKNDILCTTASANEMINEWWAEARWCCTAHSLPCLSTSTLSSLILCGWAFPSIPSLLLCSAASPYPFFTPLASRV